MTLSVDVFWSFRSPYSYLATPRLLAIRDEYDLALNFRPVRPLAVRDAGFFERVHPNWPMYVVRDVFRLAQMAGLPFAPPRPDPIVQDMATRAIAPDQPYIGRLTRLGQAAAEQGDGLAFADAVARLIWGGTPDWHEGGPPRRGGRRRGPRLDRTRPGRAHRGRAPRRRDHRQRGGAGGERPLGRAADGIRRRALLRPGPHRRAVVAARTARTDPALIGPFFRCAPPPAPL
jgi:hypothetical protein